jgi:hypothetical protein
MSLFTDDGPYSLDSLDSTIPYSLVNPLHSSNYDSTIAYSLGTTVTLDLANTDDDDTTVTINIEDNSSQYDYDIASMNSSSTVLYDNSLTIPKTV